VALVAGWSLTIALGLLSDGVHQDDDLTHFLMARWARWFPEYLLHVWGRPGLTIPLAAVAWVGETDTAWHVARALSASVTAATAALAAIVAAQLGVQKKWWVVAACYLQPLNTLLACTTLTENFAAFYLIAATALLCRGKLIAASLAFSMAMLTRQETGMLLPLWWIAVLGARKTGHRRAAAAVLAVWAPVVYAVTFRMAIGAWPMRLLSHARGSTEYLPAGWLNYLPHALEAVPPAIAGLAVVGGLSWLRRAGKNRSIRLLVVAIPAAFLFCHAAFRALGLFASGGYGRFMVTVAPFAAILAVAGMERLRAALRSPAAWPWLAMASVWLVGALAVWHEHRDGRLPTLSNQIVRTLCVVAGVMLAGHVLAAVRPRRAGTNWIATGVGLMLAVTVLAHGLAIVRPLRVGADQRVAYDAARWIEEKGLLKRPVFTTNPWLCYFLEIAEDPRVHKGPRLLAAMPVGTICIWDAIYSASDFHRVEHAALDGSPAYRLIHEVGGAPARQRVRLYEKIVETPVPAGPEHFYPPDPMAEGRPPNPNYYMRVDSR